MFKKIGLGFVGLVVLAGIGLFIAMRPQAPGHPALQGSLPPLFPLSEVYVDRSAVWNFKVSDDGRMALHRATRRITEGMRVIEVETGREVAFLPKVVHADWHWQDQKIEALHDGRIWRIDPARPARADWQDVTPRGFSHSVSFKGFEDLTGRRVVASGDRNPAFVDLYAVNSDGGDRQVLIRNDGQTLFWVLDDSQTPRLRVDRGGEDARSLHVLRGEDWAHLIDLGPEDEGVHPFSLIGHEAVWALSARGRDTRALVRLSLVDGGEEVVVEDPARDIDWVGSFSTLRGDPDYALFADGPHRIVPVSARGKVFARLVADIAPQIQVESVFPTGSGRFVTATLSPAAQSYEYWLFDLEQATSRRLAEFPFRSRNLAALAPSEWVTIPARDGLELTGVLVRPVGVTAPVPTVIEIHGGPAMHDIWAYNHFRQFLANRGYAVLSVNYRGSTGQGRAFQEAGYRTFGREMQDDIIDAARWLVDQGIADPAAMATMGTSHGGYMSAMAVLRDPDVFKAAVVEFPLLDIVYAHDFLPHAWGLHRYGTERYFGRSNDPEDRAEMAAHSPVTHASGLTRPVLLHAGRWDRITGFEQSEHFVSAAGDAAGLIDFHIFDKAGHGVHRWQDQVLRARRIEAFLHKHLGGRKEGFSLAPLAAGWIE